MNRKREKRTILQNSSMHKYCELLAQELNAAGYDVGTTITIPVDFTPQVVKEYMFKKVMAALYPSKTSTTELDTKQMQDVYENMNRFTTEKFGISVSWPSKLNRID